MASWVRGLVGATLGIANAAKEKIRDEANRSTGSGSGSSSSWGGSSSGTSGGGSTSRGSSSGSGTYIPIDNSGNDYASMVGMSDLDRAALEAAKAAYNEGYAAGDKKKMDDAHKQAQSIRRNYGYSGGDDGSQYIPEARFTYEEAPSYTNRYQDKIDDLTDQILDREPFSWDPETDPLYKMYVERYQNNGERAMRDALGQIGARTGGLASSYAVNAAQQAYNGYMGAMADKIPELRQLAYSMYRDEGDDQKSVLEMLTALEQGDYAKYQDLLSRYQSDCDFAYGSYRDTVGDRRYGSEWDYSVGRDQVSDERYTDETAYARALERAQTLAAAGDFSGYKALGYSDAEIAALKAAYERAQAAAGYR